MKLEIEGKLEDNQIEYYKRILSSGWVFDGRMFLGKGAGIKKTVIKFKPRERKEEDGSLKFEPTSLEFLEDVQVKIDENPLWQFIIERLLEIQNMEVITQKALNALGHEVLNKLEKRSKIIT